MKLKIDLTEDDVRAALKQYAEAKLEMSIDTAKITLTVETKSKQNYKSEWENAAFRVRFEAET